MTKVYYWTDDNDSIYSVIIGGHSNFSSSGTDIVCAGISAIVYGTLSFLLTNFAFSQYAIDRRNSLIKINTKLPTDFKISQHLKMMIHQLENLSQHYSDYLIIKNLNKRNVAINK